MRCSDAPPHPRNRPSSTPAALPADRERAGRPRRARRDWASIGSTHRCEGRGRQELRQGGTMSRIIQAAAAIAAVFFAAGADAQVPQGYPADYAKVIEGAKKEGKVVV